MKHAISILLCLSLAQCGLSPAWAETVEFPDAPLPAVEPGGPDASDLAASAPIGGDLAMLYTVPTAADGISSIQPTPAASPLRVRASSGGETRLSVDVGAANAMAEREGWSPWLKGTVIVVCAAIVVAGTWAIVQSAHGGSHDHDSSETLTVDVKGTGNTVNVRYGSPTSTSATTSTTTSTSSTTTGGYE